MRAALVALMLPCLASLGLGDATDEVRILRAENRILRARVASLRADLAAAKLELAKVKAAGARTPASRPASRPAQQQHSLSKMLPMAPARAQKLQGDRIMGSVVVISIDPIKGVVGQYTIEAADKSERHAGRYRRWVKDSWVLLTCVFTVSEDAALATSKGDELKVAGHIERIELVPETKARIRRVRLHLRNVRAR